ncbi:MAG: TIGR03667 family PPOX class F420-dependent oxidoreductase [Pseudonocardiales bacterium]|nr:TIGR03667 family PPOX class F420-dependent oxidoreductase [Pseudonocardiales bacterium]
MTSALPDPSTDFGARVSRRLADELIAWLTVVDGVGTPQPAPIWILWDGESALIYSLASAKRLEHLRARPRATLHFDGNGQGGDIVVLAGEIVDAPEAPPAPDNPAYLDKYGELIKGGWGTPEKFGSQYSVPLRFTPRRVRGH